MRNIWNITIDDYLEVVSRAKDAGLKPGDSMETIFIEYMKEKNKKPPGATELNSKEFVQELTSHNQKVLEINVDKEGKSNFKIHKKDDTLDKQ